jgi:hypothetical protein
MCVFGQGLDDDEYDHIVTVISIKTDHETTGWSAVTAEVACSEGGDGKDLVGGGGWGGGAGSAAREGEQEAESFNQVATNDKEEPFHEDDVVVFDDHFSREPLCFTFADLIRTRREANQVLAASHAWD